MDEKFTVLQDTTGVLDDGKKAPLKAGDEVIGYFRDGMFHCYLINGHGTPRLLVPVEAVGEDYKALRKKEYPPLDEFADAYYWLQKGDPTLMDEYIAKVEAVKVKYPKKF